MPEIQIKHVVSFSSEDKIHKAENMIKPETYRKWKCATPGEKNATIVLQFEKASQIHSIDIGNESSAFIEVLVGRSSDSLNNFQVFLVASSFMSPIESRNESHNNRVRMFGVDKFSQQLVNEKWDCVQIVCTQPFNKNISYGLSFIKFHSPPEKDQSAEPKASDNTEKLGAFKLKNSTDDTALPVGTWFGKKKESESTQSPSAKVTLPAIRTAPDPAKSPIVTSQAKDLKRKLETREKSMEPPSKKESQNVSTSAQNQRNSLPDISIPNPKNSLPDLSTPNPRNSSSDISIPNPRNSLPNTSNKNIVQNQKQNAKVLPKPNDKAKKPTPFHKILDKVVFTLSGFVNPLRSEIRDKALEMGARYKADWDKTCTHLICAFINTPKYIQVNKESGRIVSQDWIHDSYKNKTRMPWMRYMLGKSNDSSDESDDYKPDDSESESEVSEDEPEPPKKEAVKKVVNSKNGKPPRNENEASTSQKVQKSPKKANKTQTSPKKADVTNDSDISATDDESAVEDYMAKTDAESDSGGNTEDELRKAEGKNKTKELTENDVKSKKDEYPTKADLADLPLPNLPSFFKNRHFFLYGKFTDEKEHDLQRYITSYSGIIEDYMDESVKYVITDSRWDKNFDEALAENEDLVFVRSQWIFKCHELKKLVPYQPFIVIPSS
ncbi:DNA repair protein XRCC1-like [Uloborus diversus]|uniref:DNA repair protein XRCC1-like n=1 Tax=Uloborus diversus TaxID=327109 RepID=UPI00240A8C5A|nr:DNA repair protein XRCC1-like [Uloborus diversus]